MITSVASFFLIIAGALVTSTGSGLAVPDWPLSFGRFFPPMVGGVFFEHGHRMIAGTVACLVTALAVLLWTKQEKRWLSWLGTAAWFAVLVQAVLGGLTVLYRLPWFISVAHAVLAQTFFCLTACIAFFTLPGSKQGDRQSEKWSRPLRSGWLKFFAVAATALAFIQLVLGAVLRHKGGNLFLYLHVSNAFLVMLAASFVSGDILKYHGDRRELLFPAVLLAVLVALQMVLGAATAFPSVLPWIMGWAGRVAVVTMHVAFGALILATSLIAALRVHES